jgi:hypothetical protein
VEFEGQEFCFLAVELGTESTHFTERLMQL